MLVESKMLTLHRNAFLSYVLLLTLTGADFYKTYDGYKILRVTLESEADYETIIDLESGDFFEIFSEPSSKFLDILVAPKNIARCERVLKSQNLSVQVLNKNVGLSVRRQRSIQQSSPYVTVGSFSYTAYHRLTVMYDHLDAAAARHSDKAETFNLTNMSTYEGRKIQAIRITSNVTSPASRERPLVWIDGGIHAREWVSPATVMYLIDSLLGEQEQGRSDDVTPLLEKFQFVVAPCINSDGYEYTHQMDRLWRKTRKPSGCKNKNELYPGEDPFDQENVKIVKTYLEEQRDKLKVYLSYHSYSQLFLLPLGYSLDPTPDREHHVKVGKAVVAAVYSRHQKNYIAQSFAEMYPASGVSADWTYEDLNVTDSYTIELRPEYLGEDHDFQFELPEEQILGTAEENFEGLLAVLNNVKEL
ncbi:hypothetical protein ACHWQZ_G016099 [Mnemiopsis leidyi]